jgi:hypothetical protein
MSERFTSPGEMPISDGFGVATSIGLAVTSDDAITGLTGGIIQPPAAVLVVEVVNAGGTRDEQILLSSGSVAALHGSLEAWSRLLPVAARDQYEALAAESSAKWSARINAYLDGDR